MSFPKSLTFWLLVGVFIKQLVWVGLVPLWHFPDEPSHFAQVQNTAELGIGKYGYASDELAYSEEWLEVKRNEMGRNAYTLQPHYNIEYTDSLYGKWEDEMVSFPRAYTTELEFNEATSYPFLYYWLAGTIHQGFKSLSLIDRVFFIRVFSSLIFVATVWVALKIGEIIWNRSLNPIILGLLVGFHPMFSFVGASVNSDVLFNFWFTVFMYGSVKAITQPSMSLARITTSGWFWILVSIIGGLLTKQQMAIAVLALPVFILFFWKQILTTCFGTKQRWLMTIVVTILIGILGMVVARWGEIYRIWGFIQAGKSPTEVNLIEHFKWTLVHTYREILPWYWGVFKWLGVVLPRWVNRVQMAIVGLTVEGMGIYFIGLIKAKLSTSGIKKKTRFSIFAFSQFGNGSSIKAILFLAFISAFYFLMVTLWDLQFRRSFGFSFGLQGRYFFPTLVAHMALIMVGLQVLSEQVSIISRRFRLVSLLPLWWMLLHGIAWWTVAQAYYDLSSLSRFVTQASQYKPMWYKGESWLVWLGLALGSHLILVYWYWKQVKSQPSS